MSSTVEQVKARLGIVEIVSSYFKLEKAGVNWKARCPFHQEKSASFFVSPTRQSYHCFGCNRGGDIISFVQEMEGLDFLAALKQLAERAGVQIEPLAGRQDNSEREQLYRALNAAQDYYQQELAAAPAVKTYLAGRGLTAETIASFHIGFAPAGWQNLTDYLRARNYPDDLLVKAGLALRSPKNSSLYDRFRSRIMFPITDPSGRVIGFSGRIFGETDDQGGKYINSPETLVYQKGRVLYGFDRAKAEIRRAGVAILVEGQLDLILSHQAEAKNAVAVSGTALTTDHLTALRRLAETLVIAFDGDEAGVAAAKRAISMGLAAGFTVKLARLPGGIDPADLILQDKTEWTKAVEQSELVIDFLLHKAEEDSKDKLSLIHQIEAEVYPYLAALPNAHDRDHYINQIARLTQLPENSIREKLAAIKVAPVTDNKNSAPALSRRQRIIEELFGLAYLNANLGEELKKVLGDVEYHHQSTTLAPRQSELTLAAELGYAGMEASRLEGETKRLLNNLQLEIWQEEIEKLRFALGEAERRGGEQEGRELLAQLQSLYQRVNHLKNEEK